MEQYANLNGHSGVMRYEISEDAIEIIFNDRSTYLYNAEKPGVKAVAEMQRLARIGMGLETYIQRHVRSDYFRKIR
ncbi:hypothetical protein [[Enterobacter] lignolyticus]|uniref:KTSC domain-containing protein n=2 Tax=[Enterobacter] lignolyticus TaxID=1334193 RepID=E3G8F4_ENTLS|nr:hypothetical protein [[Enterobacter] lignolyticus]ADO46343.1 hypothetical protein Entcl_0065 [[Enterobacter] lignolyticus SCF1]ALR78694.1 hypothetical protein AO703_21155 [[Enterobacter] lignolyticus]